MIGEIVGGAVTCDVKLSSVLETSDRDTCWLLGSSSIALGEICRTNQQFLSLVRFHHQQLESKNHLTVSSATHPATS
jgi:3-oxoacyl-[acyl-carrier-protein] synthase III